LTFVRRVGKTRSRPDSARQVWAANRRHHRNEEETAKPKLLSVTLAVAVCGSLAAAGIASAGTTRAKTTVTIQVQNGDFSGTVDSPKPRLCAKDRKIVLFKQVGSVQDPSMDQRVGMDTASVNGNVYEWSTGNTGLFGKFYARAGKTPDCKADNSDTVRSRRT